ncbi:TPA: hypothetical protein ACNEK6_000752 [Escherichia coli]
MNPPHVAQDPVVIVGSVSCLIREIWLIALYPLVGVGPAEMPVDLCQLPNEVRRPQPLVTFGIKLNSSVESRVNV